MREVCSRGDLRPVAELAHAGNAPALDPPSRMTAHVWRTPAEIAVTPLPSPATPTGAGRSTIVPSPTCPKSFSPQHFTAPADRSAQECPPQAETAVTTLVKPTTSTGAATIDGRPVADLSAVVPPPSTSRRRARERTGVRDGDDAAARSEHVDRRRPVEPPQALDPAGGCERTAHRDGGHTAAQTDDVDRRRTVRRRSVAEPARGFEPQHLTPPAAVRAQLLSTLPAIAFTPLLSPTTSPVRAVAGPSRRPAGRIRRHPPALDPPAVASAQLCRLPRLSATTPVPQARYINGEGAGDEAFLPGAELILAVVAQHLTPPVLVSAQLPFASGGDGSLQAWGGSPPFGPVQTRRPRRPPPPRERTTRSDLPLRRATGDLPSDSGETLHSALRGVYRLTKTGPARPSFLSRRRPVRPKRATRGCARRAPPSRSANRSGPEHRVRRPRLPSSDQSSRSRSPASRRVNHALPNSVRRKSRSCASKPHERRYSVT